MWYDDTPAKHWLSRKLIAIMNLWHTGLLLNATCEWGGHYLRNWCQSCRGGADRKTLCENMSEGKSWRYWDSKSGKSSSYNFGFYRARGRKRIKMDFLNILNINLILKTFFLLIVFMYFFFSFIVFSQIRAMNSIVYVPHSSRILSIASIVHIIFVVSLFLTALAIL